MISQAERPTGPNVLSLLPPSVPYRPVEGPRSAAVSRRAGRTR